VLGQDLRGRHWHQGTAGGHCQQVTWCTHPVIRSRKAGEQPDGTASALRIAMASVVDRFVTYSDA
jgi:hypothetical protein